MGLTWASSHHFRDEAGISWTIGSSISASGVMYNVVKIPPADDGKAETGMYGICISQNGAKEMLINFSPFFYFSSPEKCNYHRKYLPSMENRNLLLSQLCHDRKLCHFHWAANGDRYYENDICRYEREMFKRLHGLVPKRFGKLITFLVFY